MPSFGKTSSNNLSTCHRDLQTLCNHLIKIIDFSVVYGHRPMSIQNALYLKGRELIKGKKGDKRAHYVIRDIAKVVTYRGFEKKSNHNIYPSKAIDIIPYPGGWARPEKIYELAGAAKAVYHKLKAEGKIESIFNFGSDWKNPPDPNHIEIKE